MELLALLGDNASVRLSSRWVILAGCGMCGLVAIALGLSALSGVYEAPPGTEPPKVTDWMQGWGSVIGVLSALVAAVLTAGLLIHEMGEARRARAQAAEERQEAAKDRAELVAQRDEERKSLARFIMTGKPQVAIVDKEIGVGQVLLVYIAVSVHNTGAIPARDVILEIKTADTLLPLARGSFELFLPDSPPVPSQGGFTRALPANNVRRVSTDFADPRPASAQVLHRESLLIELRFTDANGRRWRRVNNGDPELITPEMGDDTLPLEIHVENPKYFKSLRESEQEQGSDSAEQD